ncbi:hypothetical protein K443DRAFT_303601 [Laccaria amethystina LaAM-08-1]|uniref:Uncharacterized protein n=1 Tax=Laccaria amethystina LaAM-08-1 TaxID=1095629 RepID=A0A0C9YPD3_9AGAR|nr:hypothetical protein K443DRAFT_303601 [Laccaria amethystina LaAM-08-1]
MGSKKATFAVPRGFHWSHRRPSMTTQFTRAATELTPLLQKKSLEHRPSPPGPGLRQVCPGCTFLTSDLGSNQPQQAFVCPWRQPLLTTYPPRTTSPELSKSHLISALYRRVVHSNPCLYPASCIFASVYTLSAFFLPQLLV